MYEELAKRLRYCAVSDNRCSECKYHGGSPDGSKMCLDLLMEEAADAIEELIRVAEVNAKRAMKWAADAEKAEKAQRWIPVTEPPKEEA